MTAIFFFFFQAEDGIRDVAVTGVQTCALPICARVSSSQRVFRPLPLPSSATTTGGGRCSRMAGACRRNRSEEQRLNSSHGYISYAVFCLKKKKTPAARAHTRSAPSWRRVGTRG